MSNRYIVLVAGLSASLLAAGCTDSQGVNAATGGLLGAAVGSQIGGGSGRTAATLVGAGVGATVGANATPRRY